MKNIVKLFCVMTLLVFTQFANAQEDTILDDPTLVYDSIQTESPSRHIIKLNVPSLFVGTLSFQYEFFPVNFMSISLGYKFTPKRGMVFEDKVIDLIEDSSGIDNLESTGERFFRDFEFSGNAITPEVRFYLGQGYGKGFYLGPFLRFDNYDFSSNYNFTTFEDQYLIDFEGKYKGFGYGLNIGTQFTIGKHFTIDTSLGPYFSNVKIDFNSVSDYNLSDAEMEQLREELSDFELPNGDTEITLTNNSARMKLTSDNFFNLRFNLGIGFRF
ncbi:DUF3575 domain-containing protein [Moheibacter sediminis]|uniref:Outer membrane protein beta-barrel domain-containing protein n=1 Tax=Moheibacter sediminis TaxID=1434700 RepID=A0A1W1YHN7_9FLAO|nr:DUF3575 domain-containing protein [Moheibacter sediminis]SMC35697.1 Protein of unknown function [Moheibacter sediminis]